MSHGGNVWFSGEPDQWLDYSANIRPGGPPDWVRRALQDGLKNAAYYPDPEMRRARTALADYLNLPEAMVLPTAGGISAIDMASHLALHQVLTLAPCFEEYRRQSLNRRLRVESVSVLRGRELRSPAECARGHLQPGGLIYLCSPMNPVGAAFDRSEILSLLELAESSDGYLAVDEAFVAYCPQRSVRDLIAAHPRLMVLGSMTKILGIPGVRLGYFLAQPQIIEQLRRFQLTWELNCFAEQTACALPLHRAEIEADVQENARRRSALRADLENLGCFVYPSEASFLLTDLNRPAAPILAHLKARGILARWCTDFEGLEDGRHLRLAVKDESSNRRLIETLKEAFSCAENH